MENWKRRSQVTKSLFILFEMTIPPKCQHTSNKKLEIWIFYCMLMKIQWRKMSQLNKRLILRSYRMSAKTKLGVKEIWVATLLFWVKDARLDSLVQENSLADAFWLLQMYPFIGYIPSWKKWNIFDSLKQTMLTSSKFTSKVITK